MAAQKRTPKPPVKPPEAIPPYYSVVERICRYVLLVVVLWSPYFRGLYFDYERFPFYAALCVIMLVFFGLRTLFRKSEVPFGLPSLFLWLMVGLYAVNLSVAADRGLAYRELLNLATYFLLFLAARELFVEQYWKKLALGVFVLNGSILVVLGYAYRFDWIPPLARPLGMGIRDLFLAGRLHSTFQYPNTACAYFAMGFLAAVVLAQLKPARLWRLVAAMGGFVVLTGFFFTFSRGGLLTFPASVVFGLIFLPRQNRLAFFVRVAGHSLVLMSIFTHLNRYLAGGDSGRFFLVLAGGVLLSALAEGLLYPLLDGERSLKRPAIRTLILTALMVGILLVIGWGDLNPTQHFSRFWGLSTQDQSVFERLLFYRDAWSMVRERPLSGWGGGAWQALYLRFRSAPYTTDSPHNYFVQAMVEGGLIGFTLLIGFLFMLFYGILKMKNVLDDQEKTMSVGILSIIFMGFLHSVVDVNFALSSYAFTVWFFAGIVAVGSEDHYPVRLFGKPAALQPGLLAGGTVILLVLSILAMGGVRYTIWAESFARRGELENARFFYERAVSRDLWNSGAWYALSRIDRQLFHTGQGDFYRASSLYAARRSIELAPYQPYYLEHYGLLHLEMGQFDRGLALMEEAARRNPLTAAAYEHLMISYRTVGDFFQAQNEPSRARDYYQLALAAADAFQANRQSSLRPVREGKVEVLRQDIEGLLAKEDQM